MNVSELLAHVADTQYRAAVLEELAGYLTKLIQEESEIPVEIGDGSVPMSVLVAVREDMQNLRSLTIDKMELLDEVEVPGVASEDFVVEWPAS